MATVSVNRLCVFLSLFTFVFYLEAIGGTYMISAVQNIERHFRIPSKLSGFLVSAHDLTYIPSVIFVSYIGSKGNRAKWIGAGCIIVALSQLFTASSNFIFPTPKLKLDTSAIESSLRVNSSLLSANATIADFFTYPPLRDRIPIEAQWRVLRKLGFRNVPTLNGSALKDGGGDEWQRISDDGGSIHIIRQKSNYSKNNYELDEPLISQIQTHMDSIMSSGSAPVPAAATLLEQSLRRFIENRHKNPEADMRTIRRTAKAGFSFCNPLANALKQHIKDDRCHREPSNFGPLLVIFIGMLALGVGRTVHWTLGIPLIDDNVKKRSMPIYFALISFIKTLGPISGFLIGSAVNRLYYTFPASAPKGLSPEDPTWIGAWWLGFLIIGSIKIVPSLALYFFPGSSSKNKKKKTGKTGSIDPNHLSALPNGDAKNPPEKMKLALFDRHVKHDPNDQKGNKFKNFSHTLREILRSKVYMGTVVARIIDVMAFKGYMVFLPKYLENHYGIPQYRVHLYMAIFGVFGFALGTVCGGLIQRRFKFNGRAAVVYILVLSLANKGFYFSKSFLACESIVNGVGRSGVSTNFNYTATCNEACNCESAKLFPVCDESGQPFFSPCHAGCRHVSMLAGTDSHSRMEFSECACAYGGGAVSRERCHDDCSTMTYVFFFTVVAGSFIGGLAVVPAMLIVLRSIPPEYRSPALGLQALMVSTGSMFSPIIWGAVIDSACQLWDTTCDGHSHSSKSCLIYDPTMLRVRMHYLYVAIRLVSMLIDLYVLYHAKGLQLHGEEDEEEADKKKPESGEEANGEVATKEVQKESFPMNSMAK